MDTRVAICGGVALAALIALPVSGPLGPYLGVLCVVMAGAATFHLVRIKRASRYDLRALRELHEAGGPVNEDDIPEVAEDAGILCPVCGTVYAAWMPVCPHCKH